MRWLRGDDVAQAELVTIDNVPLDRTKGTTDVHLRGVPVLTPVVKTRRSALDKAARGRRPRNSRVKTNRDSIPFFGD